MKIALAFIAALTLGVFGFATEASAASTSIQIETVLQQDHRSGYVLALRNGKVVQAVRTPPIPPEERWFALKNGRGLIAYYVGIGGEPLVPDTQNIVASACGGQGLNCDGAGNLMVNVNAGSVVTTLPLPGNANTAAGANQSVGIQGYDGSANMVPLFATSNALNVFISGGSPITANPAQNTEYDSGVCFNSASDNAHCGTLLTQSGCAAGPVLPCLWDVSKSQGFNASLAGKTLYGFVFHSGKSMTTLNVQITCIDATTFVANSTTSPVILGDMTTGVSLGADQVIQVGGNAGRKIVNDIVCDLFAISGTTVLSTTALQQFGVLIR